MIGIVVNIIVIAVFINFYFITTYRYTVGYIVPYYLKPKNNPRFYKYKVGKEIYKVEVYSKKRIPKKIIVEFSIHNPGISVGVISANDSIKPPQNWGSWSYEEVVEMGYDIKKPFTLFQ